MGFPMKQSIAILLALAALCACGQREAKTYPPQYELNFMRACQARGAVASVCSCTWERVVREIPVDDFTAFERMPPGEQAAAPLRSELQRFALECRDEAAPAPESPPVP
jgi:hypothetical protein